MSGEELEEKTREEEGNFKPAVFREYHSAADSQDSKFKVRCL
jgi:hypothetical protein